MTVRFGALCFVSIGGKAGALQDVMIGVESSELGGSDGVCIFRHSAMLVLSFVHVKEILISRLLVLNDSYALSGNASCYCSKLGSSFVW